MHRSRAHVPEKLRIPIATAPNVITRRAPVPESEKPKAPRWETYDTEMDDPIIKTPRMAREIAELERRVITKSHSKHVEDMLMEYETNYVNSRAQQWEGQQRWMGRENEEMRMVRIMHPYRFIAALRQGGIRAEVKTDYWDTYAAQQVRIWLNPFVAKAKFRNQDGEIREVSGGLIGVNAWLVDEEQGRKVPKTVTTLQYPYGPEWSIMRFNDYNVPTKEKYRGWRTALLTLIVADVLTEEEANKCFGEAKGVASMFYREQLYNHRNHKTALNQY